MTELISSKSRMNAILSERGWLSCVPDAFREAVLARCTLRIFQSGQMIYDVADEPNGLLGFVSGQVQMLVGRDSQMHAMAHVAQPGDWIGGYGVITGDGRMVAVQARSATEVAYLSMSAIKEITEQDPTAWRWIGALPAVNMASALRAIEDLMIRDPQMRCIAVLLRLARCRGDERAPAVVWVNQTELASMSNASRSTTAALLARLEAAQMIERGYGKITILNPEGVRNWLLG